MKTVRSLAGLALLALSFPSLAATDLSRPGALERLRSQKPEHYDAVMEIAKIGERLNCAQDDLEPIKARYPVERLDCGLVMLNNNVSQRRMTFSLGGEEYRVTVRLQDTPPRLIGR
jgi:hypothetical protein